MRKKIFLFLLALIAGIGLFINFENLNPFYLIISCLILALLICLIDKRLFIFPLSLALGFSLASHKFSQYELKDAAYSLVELTIVEKREQEDGFRYFVDVYGEGVDEKSLLFSDQDYQIGDIILSDVEASSPNRNTNPNLFNYRNYLISKNIASTIEIKSIHQVGYTKSKLLKFRAGFYNYIHDLFELNLSKESSDFAISVILGENLIQNPEIKSLGLAHILAVSGLHIDMLIGFILFIFRKLRINYKFAYTTALGLCLAYGYAIGFPFSVIRVLIIHSIGFLAFLFQEAEDKVKSLMVAAILILLFNPFAILNAGFVLSFVATSGVYLIWPKIKVYLKGDALTESIGFTASIQLTLLPFGIYYYGSINLISILANFIILPIFSLVMYIIFAVIFLYPILRAILLPLFKLIDYLLYSILNITSLLGQINFLSFDFAHPDIFVVAYMYILILVIFHIKKDNKKLIRRFYASNLLIVALSMGWSYLHPEVSFSMIDIGQGDAFILNDGGDYYLFDVGGPKYKSYDSGERILVPYLKSLGIRDIKGVFISHEDMDHSGNLDIIYDNFKVDNLITTQFNMKGLGKYNPTEIKVGDRIKLKNGSITCVFDGVEGEENAESMGLLLEIEGVKILTLGDLDSVYEDKLGIEADVLKVSHHGSRSSTSRKFVEAVNPRIALISAGRNNTYGHPSKEALDNLAGVRIYNTQDRGMVKIVFEDEVRIESYLQGGYFR